MIQKALQYQTLAKLFTENEAHIFRFYILPYQSVICQFVNNVASTHKRITVISGPIPRTVRPA
jgi:hypothetical protein